MQKVMSSIQKAKIRLISKFIIFLIDLFSKILKLILG